jgi:hypothetical protein
LEFAYSPLGIRLRAQALLLAGFQALPQVMDDLAPCLCKGKCLLAGGDEIRAPPEIEVDKEACDTRERRQRRNRGSDDDGHPAFVA